jgi:microcystin-dependent protein
LVISLLALFVALGGTTYAATSLPKNSVGSQQLKKNAVTSPKIKKGAVTAAKINTQGLTVPNALHATSADSATHAVSADKATSATSATNATNAANATNAGALGGQPPSAYALSSLLGSPGPESSGTVSDSSCFVSEIKLMAGDKAPPNWQLADGSVISIASNTTLFTLLGTTYGGNGTSNFALPDLRAADPKGNGPAGVNYYICTFGFFP